MLEFDSSFFDGETRCDFYIEPTMKRVWAVEMEVLSQVIRVCEKYGIPYLAAYGTLLGAIRHKGYIPWDDDIDIALKRADYQKLLKVLPEELPEGYVVESYYNVNDHQQPAAAVMNTRYILTDKKIIQKFYGCPYICGIDIYPIDYIPDDLEEQNLQRQLYGIILSVALNFCKYEAEGSLAEYVSEIEQLCRVSLHYDSSLRQQLFLLADQIAGMYNESECKECTIISDSWERKDGNFKFPKHWFDDTVSMPFENISIKVPACYENVIKIIYGENYMMPVRFNQSHEYPFYKVQQELLDANGIYI